MARLLQQAVVGSLASAYVERAPAAVRPPAPAGVEARIRRAAAPRRTLASPRQSGLTLRV